MSDALEAAAEIDPGTLALFTQPTPPAGRTRGSFRMLTTDEPRRQEQWREECLAGNNPWHPPESFQNRRE